VQRRSEDQVRAEIVVDLSEDVLETTVFVLAAVELPEEE